MFERARHRRIARLLECLDAELLRANHCWFGGGTAIALRCNEFRLPTPSGFGLPPESWLAQQSQFDLWRAEQDRDVVMWIYGNFRSPP